MKKQTSPKRERKLTLHRETVQLLDAQELGQVAGAAAAISYSWCMTICDNCW